ncbi:hypothetical protein ACS0PU_003294 [Formica fusca]
MSIGVARSLRHSSRSQGEGGEGEEPSGATRTRDFTNDDDDGGLSRAVETPGSSYCATSPRYSSEEGLEKNRESILMVASVDTPWYERWCFQSIKQPPKRRGSARHRGRLKDSLFSSPALHLSSMQLLFFFLLPRNFKRRNCCRRAARSSSRLLDVAGGPFNLSGITNHGNSE